MKNLTFEEWFKELVAVAVDRDMSALIDTSNPEAYMEYYDDGDAPEDCFDAEYEAKSDEDLDV
jgi:hypothetical protein